MEVEVLEEVNKLREEGEGANRVCWEGGPTKLPEKGGGQHQRPGKEEPLVGRRQEGASDHHRQHCWSLFLVGFLHPVRWHPPDNGRQCGGKLSSRFVNIPASLQFVIVFNILTFATQAASTFSTHSEGRGVEITEDSLPKLRDEVEESRNGRRRRRRGKERSERRDQGGAQDTP